MTFACFDIRLPDKNNWSYFSTKTYAVGTQKNRLNDTVLLSIQNGKSMFKLIDTKCFIWTIQNDTLDGGLAVFISLHAG